MEDMDVRVGRLSPEDMKKLKKCTAYRAGVMLGSSNADLKGQVFLIGDHADGSLTLLLIDESDLETVVKMLSELLAKIRERKTIMPTEH